MIALTYGYRFGKGFNCVLTSFDYDYKHIRPGYLLIEEMLKEIEAKGETFYNWYGGERFYKHQVCNQIDPLYSIILYRTLLHKKVDGIVTGLRKIKQKMRLR